MLARLFAAHHARIVDTWIEGMNASGNCSTTEARFVDPSPVLRNAATALYETAGGQAFNPDDPDDPRLRAVLDFAAWQATRSEEPSQTAGSVYLFKPLLREYILPQATAAGRLQEYLEVESRLDSLALIVFAEYTRSRERLQFARLEALRREQAAIRRWAERHGLNASGDAL